MPKWRPLAESIGNTRRQGRRANNTGNHTHFKVRRNTVARCIPVVHRRLAIRVVVDAFQQIQYRSGLRPSLRKFANLIDLFSARKILGMRSLSRFKMSSGLRVTIKHIPIARIHSQAGVMQRKVQRAKRAISHGTWLQHAAASNGISKLDAKIPLLFRAVLWKHSIPGPPLMQVRNPSVLAVDNFSQITPDLTFDEWHVEINSTAIVAKFVGVIAHYLRTMSRMRTANIDHELIRLHQSFAFHIYPFTHTTCLSV